MVDAPLFSVAFSFKWLSQRAEICSFVIVTKKIEIEGLKKVKTHELK